jgi:hypothetical protein
VWSWHCLCKVRTRVSVSLSYLRWRCYERAAGETRGCKNLPLDKARASCISQTLHTPRLQPALQLRLQEHMGGVVSQTWALVDKEPKRDPLQYMQLCRKYLAKLDTLGWNQNYHQRLFHDDFLKVCTRNFWKLETPGQFARDHQRVLCVNAWDHIAQEILISSPCRFGKTISVSMF